MGSVGFFEVLLVLVVALLILGPDKLLTAARYGGLLIRKARILWTNITDEFDRQLRLDEMIKNNVAPPKDKKKNARKRANKNYAKTPSSATKSK